MKRFFTSLCICLALLFASCVDREFDLAETSGEITIGGEELIIPLGEIGSISVEDLLKNNDTLTESDNGVYQISFSSFGNDPSKYEEISVDGVKIDPIHCELPQLKPITFNAIGELPQSFRMSGLNSTFAVNIPTISNVMDIEPIKSTQDLSVKLPLSGKGTITSAILEQLKRMNATTLNSSSNEEVVFDAELSILKELKEVKWVEFGCEDHPYGAPFEAKLALNGLNDINGGGELKFRIEFPEGYHLCDENGNELAAHNIFEKVYSISPKQKEVDILLYLAKIDYKGEQFTDGKLKIDDHIRYSYELTMNLGTGNYDLGSLPKFTFMSEPKYKDVEIVIGKFEAPNNEDEIHCDVNYTFNGLPSVIKVSKVAFKSAPLKISLKGLEWLKVRCYDTGEIFSPEIEVALPPCMNFKNHDLLKNGNTLIATTEQLANGVTLEIDNIDANADGVRQENGQLIINTQLIASLHLEGLSNHTIHISSLTPPASYTGEVSLSIADTTLVLDTDKDKTVIETAEELSFPLDLGDQVPTISQEIEIPEMVSAIKRINIGKANSTSNEPVKMTFSLRRTNTFPVDELLINATVNLGKLLRPTQKMFDEGLITKNDNGDYLLSIDEVWKPKQAALTKTLEFDALENLPEIANGKISLNQSFPVTGSAKINMGEQPDILANAEINIDLAIDDIEVRTFEGCLNVGVKPETMTVELGNMDNLGININSLSINPILKFNLKDNPVGVGLAADIVIKTLDSNNNQLNEIVVPTIAINERGASNIVISTAVNANKYKGDDITFVEISGLSSLFAKSIPSKIVVDMKAYSDNNKEVTLNLKDAENGYKIEYQYEVIVPFAFDGDFDISYETSVRGLNSTFKSLAESTEGISVGDIGLLGVFGSTIPFDVVVSAELIDKQGSTEGISAHLNINNCLVKGSDNSGTKRYSEIDFEFDLGGNGSLAGLKKADGIKLKLTLYNANRDQLSTIAKKQFIDGKLELRIRNGLTIDLLKK